VGLEPTPVLDGGLHRHALLDLAEIDEIVEGKGNPEVIGHPGEDASVPADVALVVFHQRRGRVERRFGQDRRQQVRRRERLVPELRDEAGLGHLVGLEGRALVPDVPVVDVAPFGHVGIVPVLAAGRRSRPVGPRGVFFCDGLADRVEIQRPVVLGQLAVFVGLGEPVVQRLLVFVVATPQRDAGVVGQPPDLIAGFGLDGGEKGVVGGVQRTGVHEVLPDEQAEFVTPLVEVLVFVVATAPHADHVHVRVNGALQAVVVDLVGHPVVQRVGGNPVCALGEDGFAVDDKIEGLATSVCLADEFDLAESDPVARTVAAPVDGHIEVIEGLVTVAGRPPQIGIVDGECQRHLLVAGVEAHGLAGLGPGNARADGRLGRPRHVQAHVHRERHAVARVVLLALGVGDPWLGKGHEFDVAPDAHRCDTGAPVPAVVTLGFPDKVSRGEVVGIPERRHLVGVAVALLDAVPDGRVEANADLVFAGFERPAHVELVAPMHVVPGADFDPVDRDGRHGVQPVTDEYLLVVIEHSLVDLDGASIHPVGLGDPLDVEFVVLLVGIVDLARREQIAVDAAWYRALVPVVAVDSRKLPATV